MRPARDRDVLIQAARMYFLDGASQQRIAAHLGTSRSNVSRMLAAARELGIVEIRIHDGAGRQGDVEAQLQQRFGLTDVRVSSFSPRIGSGPATDPLPATGRLASEWLLESLHDGQRIALSWGSCLQAMVWATPAGDAPLLVEVVQLVGGLSAVNSGVTGQELVRELAARLGATYRYLHAPALLASPTALEALLGERSVSSSLDAARSADIAVVGVGSHGFGSSSAILDAITLSPEERAAFEAATPAGDICARYYDIDGVPVAAGVDNRVLGVTLGDLRRIPRVVGVTAGREKGPGLLGALRGRLLDVLICDEAAARAALALDDELQGPDRRSA
jgi:DNA-binding transcriptional regulator LsrR (DeoR family)